MTKLRKVIAAIFIDVVGNVLMCRFGVAAGMARLHIEASVLRLQILWTDRQLGKTVGKLKQAGVTQAQWEAFVSATLKEERSKHAGITSNQWIELERESKKAWYGF